MAGAWLRRLSGVSPEVAGWSAAKAVVTASIDGCTAAETDDFAAARSVLIAEIAAVRAARPSCWRLMSLSDESDFSRVARSAQAGDAVSGAGEVADVVGVESALGEEP